MIQLVNIMKNPHPYVDVYVNNDNIRFWKLVFVGPESTPYSGGCWLVYMQFDEDYPNTAPDIRFLTPIKHCNINNYGRICHSILDRNYVPTIDISLIIECVYGLLLNPDVSDPLDTNLALKFYEANGEYEATIIEHVEEYGSKSREEWKKELEPNVEPKVVPKKKKSRHASKSKSKSDSKSMEEKSDSKNKESNSTIKIGSRSNSKGKKEKKDKKVSRKKSSGKKTKKTSWFNKIFN